jgi:N6-L-threonylcarbamoyladenine synthase
MPLLAVETSCDETSVAVVDNGRVLANIVSSQIKLHTEYGGVVPELATREHLRNLQPVAREALQQANLSPADLDAIAATRGPGLPPALLIGWTAAQATAYALNLPLIGINHIEAHLYSPWITGEPPAADFDSFEPNLSLIASGGHTQLVHVRAIMNHTVLGGTLDDAAGECFDKIAKLLGLAYPGGPEIDRLSENGNPAAHNFPRPIIDRPDDDFSFSGLKTSVRYYLEKNPELKTRTAELPNLCASAQAAIVDVLVKKTLRAANRESVQCITASGGVTRNRSLRKQLAATCAKHGIQLRLAPPALCTDNAAMIGILAEQKLKAGEQPASMAAGILPGKGLQAKS